MMCAQGCHKVLLHNPSTQPHILQCVIMQPKTYELMHLFSSSCDSYVSEAVPCSLPEHIISASTAQEAATDQNGCFLMGNKCFGLR